MSTTTQDETIQIAQIIIDQIKFTDRSALMAWGSRHYAAISPSKEFQGGLSFQVNGRLKDIKWVSIKLRWVDDYTIVFTNKKREVVKIVENVFCDMLVDIIDYIEKGE